MMRKEFWKDEAEIGNGLKETQCEAKTSFNASDSKSRGNHIKFHAKNQCRTTTTKGIGGK